MSEFQLPVGIYEKLIDSSLQEILTIAESNEIYVEKEPIDDHEVNSILSKYLQSEIACSMTNMSGHDKVQRQIELANNILSLVRSNDSQQHVNMPSIPAQPEKLLSISSRNVPGIGQKKKSHQGRPITGLSYCSLFTGAEKESSLSTELKKELQSSNTVWVLMSFIKWSGLRIMWDAFQEFTSNPGNSLRIVTTTYMAATEIRCLDELSKLPRTEVRVSLDSKHTRLHAKAYLFKRNTGYHTAYIGSSNISNPAITSGLEWNVKLTAQDAAHIISKYEASYDAIWNSDKFIQFSEETRELVAEALNVSRQDRDDKTEYFFDVKPFLYQRDILERLQAERLVHNRHRNLVVSATGTGKTVISALDFKRFLLEYPDANLLFVAHRREILDQSLKCFRGVLRNLNFGELLTGIDKSKNDKNLFASIQLIHSKEIWNRFKRDHFDFIIVDEFHHAEAKTYRNFLDYFEPKVLLGLTATPERMDGADILHHFDGRIAAEIRLYDAIDRNLLCPFQYFGVSDDVDLSQLAWKQGGYLIADLENVYTGNEARVQLIVDALRRYSSDVEKVIGLGFCVSVKHAEFMAKSFNRIGIKSEALSGESDQTIRQGVKQRLLSGDTKFIFTVDLFNEGVDIPEVNTVLFLRPTQSMTVFIQQLGRGLRLFEGKECLTVLDFIGQAHKKYRFDVKFKALLKDQAQPLKKEIDDEFPHLPSGCYIKLEKLASDRILENIRQSVNSNKKSLISRIAEFSSESALPLTLKNFVTHHGISLPELYSSDLSWTQLCGEAGVTLQPDDPDIALLTRGIRRIVRINSSLYLDFIRQLIAGSLPSYESMSPVQQKFFWMFYYRIWQKAFKELDIGHPDEAVSRLIANERMCAEILEILEICSDSSVLSTSKIELGYPCPLELHCDYSRDEVLSAFGRADANGVQVLREGVKYLPELKTDLLFVTLYKSDKDFSPTTMYDDYAINERLFHWQTQVKISDHTPNGHRYIHHAESGGKILLFVRERKDDNGSPAPYSFLGPVNYVSHIGNQPMSITFALENEMPARIWRQADKFSVAN